MDPTRSSGVDEEVRALLAIWVDVPKDLVADFERWYDEDHLPERRALPFFLSASRFDGIDAEPNRMALYELATVEAVRTEPYLATRRAPDPPLGAHVREGWHGHTRVVYRLTRAFSSDGSPTARLDAPVLLTVRLLPPDGGGYAAERLAAVSELRDVARPGVRACHVFESVEEPFQALEVWSLDDRPSGDPDGWSMLRHSIEQSTQTGPEWRKHSGLYRRAASR